MVSQMLRALFCNLDTKCLRRQVNVGMMTCADKIQILHLIIASVWPFILPLFSGEKTQCRLKACLYILCALQRFLASGPVVPIFGTHAIRAPAPTAITLLEFVPGILM